ncbi:MAG: DUF2066 domain-containing protein [Frateuria sp.]|uniref:DUF2066 domain-containing protein n=1 Tax=Frateuria sp. TaxID=2211372 RepID=UPI00180C6772|nr:DUF2066 domain-containing protein [Frateuria sp.]NUO73455.1 DUF2066 domain-containing protein [Frateuria sp.]NUR21274.1 DUF2066 domain-containing protein [Frateuria sp.]
MRLHRLLLAVLLLGFAAIPLHAQTAAPASPYAVVVPVTDTSEAQRDQAFGTALGQVLERVAGGQDLRDKPGYDEALKGAPGLVQQFQYQRAGTGIVLQVNFDPGAVRRLVTQLGVAAAGVKPPVLALVRGSDGSMLGKDSLGGLAQAAAAHGYTLAYPDPARPPDAKALAGADPAALAQVTQRYRTGLILVGNLKGGSAEWTLVSGGKPQSWSDQAVSEGTLLADAGNTLAEHLGKQLNVIGASVSNGKLWVGKVDSAQAYANLLAMLRADPSVREVSTLGADNGGFLFAVRSSVPTAALATSLAAGGRVMQAAPHAGADASLQWLH